MTTSTIANKISSLSQMAHDLRQGKWFNITRLTSLKSLCADPQAAGQFCFSLACLTQARMKATEQPHHLDEKTWLHCQHLVDEAVLAIATHFESPTKETEESLQTLLVSVREVNNHYKNQAWGPVRIIQSKEVLLLEEALYAILRPRESSHWGYQIARNYAERYHPSYGSGLIPESAPRVEEIANFWSQYYFGQPLDEWLNSRKRRSKAASPKES